ncbi:MAG: GAF domain-containing protein [Candidatus Riflebacteria bacterium]|nr:GAF domain-containing protein [Candidatus Riflebacteria bacterium]
MPLTAALTLALPAAAGAGTLEFTYPGSPLPWLVAEILAVLLVVAVGALLFLFRFVLGDKRVRLKEEVRQTLEKTFLEKQREEFKKKTEALNLRVKEVRHQLGSVFIKVKNLATTLDPGQVFQAITEMLSQEIGAARFILFLHDREKNELYPFRWQEYPDSIRETLTIPMATPHFLTFAFRNRRHVYRLAATEDAETRTLVDQPPLTGTLLALPIYTLDETFGVIHIESFRSGREEIDEGDLRFFASLGSFMGMALANANVLLQTRDELTSTKQLTEQQLAEKKRLKEVFSRYTSSELVDSLMKNPGSVRLGGITKTATILFSDIVGFTKFSEKLTPEEVVLSINEYLSRMTEIVLDNNGEIDKFIGDAVMARFGVLADLPSPGLVAVRTAMTMLEEVKRLQAKWLQEGREAFAIRIGVATGPVLAGNIGSERRQEFTVMGTTVNLASRLESLNKELGTSLLIDETTYEQVGDEYRVIPRENISIRGLVGTRRVFEVQPIVSGAMGPRGKIIQFKDKMGSGKAEPHLPAPTEKLPVAPGAGSPEEAQPSALPEGRPGRQE